MQIKCVTPDQTHLRIVRIDVYNRGMQSPAHAHPATHRATPLPSPSARTYAFNQLSAGQRTLLIEHAGQVYRLSLTGQNKLILTK